MGQSTGIVLTATAISFANEYAQEKKPNFRIIIAGLGVALIFDGIEKVNTQLAVGLGILMTITVLVTPVNKKAPFDTVNDWLTPTTGKA